MAKASPRKQGKRETRSIRHRPDEVVCASVEQKVDKRTRAVTFGQKRRFFREVTERFLQCVSDKCSFSVCFRLQLRKLRSKRRYQPHCSKMHRGRDTIFSLEGGAKIIFFLMNCQVALSYLRILEKILKADLMILHDEPCGP